MATLARVLRSRRPRLLVLTGPGGVGKTRLALAAASEAASAFADGAIFVSLAPVREPTLLATAIARATGVRETGGVPLADHLRRVLRERDLLLLLDNFEHLLPAAGLVGELLAASPNLTALITSRARLRLTGEHDVPVPPLALPDVVAGGRRVLDTVRQAAAVRVFVARAAAVEPAFRLDELNAPVVAEICRRLDGLPLAIELAAAHSRVLPPPALLARLGRRLPLLASGPRDQPARLQTMRNAIAWSYDLLRPDEQAIFRCLAVFVGGVGLEAAEAVCRAPFDGVCTLVDQNLLQPLAAGNEPRFSMLETVREFGIEQLAATQEETATRHRHAAWHLALAEHSGEARRRGPMPTDWLDRIEVEHDNLRIALSWLERRGSAEDSLRLAGELAPFWLRRSYRSEGRGWLGRALDRARTAPVDPTVQVHALIGAASMAFTQSDYSRAAALSEEGLARSRDLGHDYTAALFLNLLGAVARARGFPRRGAADFEAALALFRAEGVTATIGVALCNLGALACGQGDLDRAASALAEAHALFAEIDDAYWLAVTLSNLGDVALDQGDLQQAATCFARSLSHWRGVRTMEVLADWLARVAGLAVAQGQAVPAARLLGTAEALRETLGYQVEQPEEQRYERTARAIRRRIGAAAFDGVWREGRALEPERALDEAAALLATAEHEPQPEVRLTLRELEVLRLLVDGRSDPQIAHALSISPRTVESHVSHILTKLVVESRTAAVAHAVRHELV